MYYIDNYRRKAVNKIIPYLIDFPQIIKIIESSADRYQAIENVLWEIAGNTNIKEAHGVFLKAHLHNEATNIIYTDVARDAFQYGTQSDVNNGTVIPIDIDPETGEEYGQGYGIGHYYNQTSYISGSNKSISEEKMLRALQAKIIENNTKCTVEDFIEAIKLIYNATHVEIRESYPLAVSLTLQGPNLEISSSGNYEVIKRILPACVSVKNIYIDQNNYDVFKYDDKSYYGISRYPIYVGETLDRYNNIYPCISLNNTDNEYIKSNFGFQEDDFYCFLFKLKTNIDDGYIFYFSDDLENFALKTKLNVTDNQYYFCIEKDGEEINTLIQASTGVDYTLLISNDGNSVNLWILNRIQLEGNYENDINKLRDRLLFSTPDILLTDNISLNDEFYLNSDSSMSNFNNCIYYALIKGTKNNEENTIELLNYYTTSYGEKNILFNCLNNEEHLKIYTNSDRKAGLTENQQIYNYKKTHSCNRYLYLDGSSSVDYNITEDGISCNIEDFELSFDICWMFDNNDNVILSNFIKNDNTSSISISSDGILSINFEAYNTENEEFVNIGVSSSEGAIQKNKYYNIRIVYSNDILNLYIDNKIVNILNLEGNIIQNITDVLYLGKDDNKYFNGLINNIKFNVNNTINEENTINTVNFECSLNKTLSDNNNIYIYTNNGARFITVPQLIQNKNNQDLYGRNTIGVRQ